MAAGECTSRGKRKGLWSPRLGLLCRLKFRWWALLHSVLLGLRFFLELIAAAPCRGQNRSQFGGLGAISPHDVGSLPDGCLLRCCCTSCGISITPRRVSCL